VYWVNVGLHQVGWVRFFGEAKKRNPTKVYWVNVGLRYRAKLDKLTRPTWLGNYNQSNSGRAFFSISPRALARAESRLKANSSASLALVKALRSRALSSAS